MSNILLLAPPAAGKGTQAELLHEHYGIIPISTGQLLRNASQGEDTFGKEIQSILKSGLLVDDSIVLKLLKSRLEEISGYSFLLDGFPRNVNQANLLDSLLESIHEKIDYVFLLDVPKSVLEHRVSGRRICKDCGKSYNIHLEEDLKRCICGGELITRNDEDVFSVRYETYLQSTLPLIEYYEKKGILHRIDANQNIGDVFLAITSTIDLEDFND